MYCPNCGTPNAETSRFCKQCGAALSAPPVGKVTAAPQLATTSRASPPRPRRLVFALAGVVLLAVASVVVSIIARSDADIDSVTPTPTHSTASTSAANTPTLRSPLATAVSAFSPLATPVGSANSTVTAPQKIADAPHKMYLPLIMRPDLSCPDSSPYGLSKNLRSRLGCPAQGFIESRKVIIQRFQNGVMVVFAKPTNTFDNKSGALIYALTNDGHAWRITDSFVETSSNPRDWYSCDVRSDKGPESTGVPWRGFGKAWCEHPEVRRALGKALSAEQSGMSASFQSYELGRAFQVFDWRNFPGWDKRSVYVVSFASVEGDFLTGTWERK